MNFLKRWSAYVVYSDAGLRANAAGIQYRNGVQIRPEHAGDAGLLAHELRHVRQWQMCIVATALLCLVASYIISPVLWFSILAAMCSIPLGEKVHGDLYAKRVWYRLWAEVDAFRVQLRHYPERTDSIADWMASKESGYQFNITKEQAMTLLTKGT